MKTGSRFSRGPDVQSSALTVLHIDDDPNDTQLLRAAARKACVPFYLQNVSDGDEAVSYLLGKKMYADRQRFRFPDLVLLDLRMPRATGFELLKWIRGDPRFHELPVIVLSGSELSDDILRAYAFGANSYFVKPLGFNALVDLVRKINTTWLPTRPLNDLPVSRPISDL